MKSVLFFSLLMLSTAGLLFSQNLTGEKAPAAEQDEETLIRTGILLSDEGRYEEAISLFRKAISRENSKGAIAYHNLGFAYELSGDKVKAMDAYREASERNPEQVITLSRLGTLQYELGQYRNAINTGEEVLRKDPRNQEIRKWLPDAYAKAAEQRLFYLGMEEEETTGTTTGGTCSDNTSRQYLVEYSVQPALLYNRNSSSFSIHKQSGLSYLPMSLRGNAFVANEFEVEVALGSPDFGILQPNFMAAQESILFRIYSDRFFYGFGLLFTQINMSENENPGLSSYYQNDEFTDLSDSKIGLHFGTRMKKTQFEISVYPNYPLGDAKSGPTSSAMDYVRMDLSLRTQLNLFKNKAEKSTNWPFFLTFAFSQDEVYLTEYDVDGAGTHLGHYFGTYDISLGFELGELKRTMNGASATFGMNITERLYGANLSNETINQFGNGQGFFGFSTESAISGNAFPGFRSNSHILTLYSRQLVFNHVILKEAVSYEHTLPFEPYLGILTEFSAGYVF